MAEYGGLEHDPDYFSVHFKDYMDEKLERNRLEITAKPPGYKDFSFFEERHWKGIKWVFWSKKTQQDDSRKRRRSDDDSAIREVRQNIRCALEKMILYPCLDNTLVQFWAPTRTVEGRTKLTTQNQPFALGHTYNKGSKKLLSEYRMKIMYEGYNFYVDAQSGEEEHGVPGRVYLHKLPECTPDVKYYSLKEYPQRDLALSNSIGRSWALPVFERSSQMCIGVLEILGLTFSACDPAVWHEKSFLGHLCDIFQEFGLQCFEGYRHCEMQFRDENKALTTAFQELKMVLRSVCEIHELPLAMTWVPCSSCDNLLRGHLLSEGVEFCNPKHGNVKSSDVINFSQVSKWSHLRKGWVAGTALSSPSMLCCWDMTQISLAEYPFVPYARRCKFHGWFTICLRSSYTGEEIYVLEFFLPKSSRYRDKSSTSLSPILRTMKEKFETFKLASGQELGEELSVEAIEFPNGQKLHSVHSIKAGIPLPCLEPLQNGGGTMQLRSLDQPSRGAINNGTTVVSTEGNNISSLLPVPEGSQNGVVMMQLDSLDQPSKEAINCEMNFVNTEQNCVLVTSSEEEEEEEEGTIKTRERDHKSTGVKIDISLEDILRCSSMTRDNAASELGVSISTLRRACKDYGIHRWPPHNTENLHPTPPLLVDKESIPQLSSDPPSNQTLVTVPHIRPHDPAFQDANMVTIRAKYVNDITLKFRLSTSSGIVELQNQVAKRLNLDAGTYNIRHKDEDGELILLACDEDLQACMHTSKSLGKTSVVVLLEPK